MCVRWLATVRSPRNSAAATSRFVRPSATRSATRRSAAVSPSSRVRPPMRPELGARPLDPAGRPELLEAGERRARSPRGPARFCRARRRTMPSASSARARPKESPTASCCATACSRSDSGPIDVALGGGHETAAPRHVREHPVAAEPRRIRLPGVEDAHRLVDPAELEQRLDVVGGPRGAWPARPTRASRPAGRPCRASPRRRARLRPRARRARGSPDGGADGARAAPRRAPGPAPSARGRARAGRDGRRSTRSGGSPAAPRARTGR